MHENVNIMYTMKYYSTLKKERKSAICGSMVETEGNYAK